jgi:hypothetical protein
MSGPSPPSRETTSACPICAEPHEEKIFGPVRRLVLVEVTSQPLDEVTCTIPAAYLTSALNYGLMVTSPQGGAVTRESDNADRHPPRVS